VVTIWATSTTAQSICWSSRSPSCSHDQPPLGSRPNPLVVRVGFRRCSASSTAAKYSSSAALQRSVGTLSAALPCSTRVGDVAARGGSGRRDRRFKSRHPDQRSRSLNCANAALRWPAFHSNPPSRRPKGTEKEHEGPHRKPGSPSTGRRTPGLPPRPSRPTGTAGTSGHSDPPSATKRPPGRNVRRP